MFSINHQFPLMVFIIVKPHAKLRLGVEYIKVKYLNIHKFKLGNWNNNLDTGSNNIKQNTRWMEIEIKHTIISVFLVGNIAQHSYDS